jgi:hypothetical protein
MLWMIAFAALWAFGEAAVASRLRHPYSPYQVVWARYGSHLAIMLAIWGWRDPRPMALARRLATRPRGSGQGTQVACSERCAHVRKLSAPHAQHPFGTSYRTVRHCPVSETPQINTAAKGPALSSKVT